ncbi:hypothetical protein ISG10_12410 [Burkholderia pseudomallei]|nr:hypothetical protein [Burkholderia pseudomallei]MBF3600672.1 hypothetical protein [Burkholderia pseudomallei]
MKFVWGDLTDVDMCRAMRHEFLRCAEAYADFIVASNALREGDETRQISYRAYNAYARFLLHLYEFLIACEQRARCDTAQIVRDDADVAIAVLARRAYERMTAPLNAAPLGAAPYNGGITESMDKLKTFAAAFRQARNTAMGHVKHQRSKLNLSDFYQSHHRYLLALYSGATHMWGSVGDEFPDLGEVTKFSVLVKNAPPDARIGV